MSKVTRTDIQWCDYSVNPIRALTIGRSLGWHCERVSEGCAHCYSATLNKRFGTGLDYAADKTPRVEFYLDGEAIRHMLTFKPRGPFKNGRERAAVFPFDMTDLFGHWVPDEWILKIFAVFVRRQDVDFLVLTKRSRRMRETVQRLVDMNGRPFQNVWLGVSAENQERADERIPELLATPAAVRFVSLEPLLGPMNVGPLLGRGAGIPKIHWAIVGGESGHGARPCDVSWIRDIRDQCNAAGVPLFLKQLGAYPIIDTRYIEPGATRRLKDRKGGDPAEWSEDLRVREMPR